MGRFIQADRSQPFLLPPDLREWLPADDLAHFVLEAAERVPLERFQVNERNSGSEQYHPQMMLALLIYSYANGIFSSRRIERASYRDIGVRYITANTHPDHDTICKFRRENLSAISESFLQVLLLAKELKLLRVGTVSVDGTKIDANASKHRGVRYDRAKELRAQLELEIAQLLEQAEGADSQEGPDGQQLPQGLKRREVLKSKLDAACARLEAQAKARAENERAEYERKVAAREKRQGRRKGKRIKPPREVPEESEQSNLTDPDSRLMRKNKRSEYRQAYNAQAVVDAEGSQLVLGTRVSQCASDRNELVANMDAVPGALEQPERVLADSGYASGDEVAEVSGRAIDVLVATGKEGKRRLHDLRPAVKERAPKEPQLPWMREMQRKLEQPDNKTVYRLRQQTVEPVFGIVKEVLGFRRFLLRGVEKVSLEWQLVTLAYNCKRLHRMTLA